MVNPYAPPRAAVEDRPAEDCWREGNVLVLRSGNALPERCVKCNEPAVKPVETRTFYWHSGGWYLLILLNVVIYFIAALIVRRKTQAAVGVCAKHLLRRRVFSFVGWGGLLLGIAVCFAGRDGILPGFLIIVVTAIAGVVGSRLVYPIGITKAEIRFKGCGEAFLASLELKQAQLAPAGVDVGSQGLCPNCDKVIPLASALCPHCQANFGEGAAWKVEPLRTTGARR
jgi:hypothetical protein